jgi:type 1 glutamine amidotransferase
MTEQRSSRAHLIAGGFPPGSSAGHDHDYARLRLLGLLAEQEVAASVGNDFGDVEKWLPTSRLLVTYVAGPYPDAPQCRALGAWLEAGGHWLGLHGTSGGRAERVEGLRQRRTVRTEHHGVLGSMFLTHPPICTIQVKAAEHPLTRGVGGSFEVVDEPYFVELIDPGATEVLLSAAYGAESAWPVVDRLYGSDRSLQADGRTRVLGYTRRVGNGAVTYFALGHCHNPGSRPGDEVFHGAWESDAFISLLRNAIVWRG